MKKGIVLLAFLMLASLAYGNKIVNHAIKLEKHLKVQSTFSGDFSGKNSFHIVFTKNKNTKKYESFIYLFDGVKTEKLGVFSENIAHGVNTFFRNGDVLSLLLNYREDRKDYLKRIDIHTDTKTIKKYEPISNEDALTSVRTKDKVYLLFKDKKKLVAKVFGAEADVKEFTYMYRGRRDLVKKYFKNAFVTAIKTDEFVANGAVSNLRLYLTNNTFVFTKTEDNKKTTEVLSFPMLEESFVPKFITVEDGSVGKLKKATSYVENNKIYVLGIKRKEGRITVFDLENGKQVNKINLNKELLAKARSGKDFKDIANFLKQASRGRHNATITVNKAKNNALNIRVDYVDKEYSYNHDWWWWHQQMWHNTMMMNHQRMMNQVRSNIPNGFGPRVPNDVYFETYKRNKEKVYFEFSIDVNGYIQDAVEESLEKEIDKKKYIDKLDDVRGLKHESSCFVGDDFRFVGYNRSLKSIIIQTNKIK